MRDSILTIPIDDIFEDKTGCPFCTMRNMLEERCVKFILSDAMMEPDVRIETNKMGFCKTHYDMMLGQKNRLSLALMISTHLAEIEKNLSTRNSLFNSKKSKNAKISYVTNSCFICSKVEAQMQKLMVTFFEMYNKSENFRTLFKNQEKLCLCHYDTLMSVSSDRISKKLIKEFNNDCITLLKKELETLIEDTVHFTKMFDYRNTGKDADWGNSRDSIERAITFLTTR